MRWAKSYSIVDHQLLHGGYFQKLSHPALVLYLFLVVVADKNGKSFYADLTIEGILRFAGNELEEARSSLIRSGLIDYRSPNWWVKTLAPGELQKNNPRVPASSGMVPLRSLFQNLIPGGAR